jgi:hypothetical protein
MYLYGYMHTNKRIRIYMHTGESARQLLGAIHAYVNTCTRTGDLPDSSWAPYILTDNHTHIQENLPDSSWAPYILTDNQTYTYTGESARQLLGANYAAISMLLPAVRGP